MRLVFVGHKNPIFHFQLNLDDARAAGERISAISRERGYKTGDTMTLDHNVTTDFNEKASQRRKLAFFPKIVDLPEIPKGRRSSRSRMVP